MLDILAYMSQTEIYFGATYPLPPPASTPIYVDDTTLRYIEFMKGINIAHFILTSYNNLNSGSNSFL